MTDTDQERSNEILTGVLTTGLFLMAACLLFRGVGFHPRYVLVMVPVALLTLILASVRRGELLQSKSGRFALVFALMLCYDLSSTARLSLPRLNEQFPWLLPWSAIVLVALAVVCIYGLASGLFPGSRIAGLWQPALWSLGIILACGLAIKLAVDHRALVNEAYQTPDWLEPKFRFFHLVYRCVEYGLLFLVASLPAPGKSCRLLAFAIAAVLILKVVWH